MCLPPAGEACTRGLCSLHTQALQPHSSKLRAALVPPGMQVLPSRALQSQHRRLLLLPNRRVHLGAAGQHLWRRRLHHRLPRLSPRLAVAPSLWQLVSYVRQTWYAAVKPWYAAAKPPPWQLGGLLR